MMYEEATAKLEEAIARRIDVRGFVSPIEIAHVLIDDIASGCYKPDRTAPGNLVQDEDGEYVEYPYRRLTWREVAEGLEGDLSTASSYRTLLFDLDRCEHGRHEGDVCGGESGCNGPSKGNPMIDGEGRAWRLWRRFIDKGEPIPDRLMGFTMDGAPIVYPLRVPGESMKPESWVLR